MSGMIDWMWCYENPKEAAAEIERLQARNMDLLEKASAETGRLRNALREIAEFKATEPWRLTAKTMREMADAALR